MVEFALVAPFFLSLLLGVFTGGMAYFEKLTMAEAVRDGARYGAAYFTGTGTGELATWEAAVKARVAETSGGVVSSANVCAKLVPATSSSACGVSDPAGASAETTVRLVKVSATKTTKLEFFFFELSRTMTAQFVARYERDTG